MAIVWQDEYEGVLEKYADLVGLVWRQVQKDFSMEAIELKEAEISTLNDVFLALEPQITRLIQLNFNDVMRLLYRIDISEEKVRKQMDIMPDDASRAMTILILRREIEKVVLRKQYSA